MTSGTRDWAVMQAGGRDQHSGLQAKPGSPLALYSQKLDKVLYFFKKKKIGEE